MIGSESYCKKHYPNSTAKHCRSFLFTSEVLNTETELNAKKGAQNKLSQTLTIAIFHLTSNFATKCCRLICRDNSEVLLPAAFFEKFSLFRDHPELTSPGVYECQCHPRQETVNVLLTRVYDESKSVLITTDNAEELRSLCHELGFSGLDRELNSFETEERANEILSLKARVTRHERSLIEFQRQFTEAIRERKQAEEDLREFVVQQVQTLEQRFEEAMRRLQELIQQSQRTSQVPEERLGPRASRKKTGDGETPTPAEISIVLEDLRRKRHRVTVRSTDKIGDLWKKLPSMLDPSPNTFIAVLKGEPLMDCLTIQDYPIHNDSLISFGLGVRA